MQPFLMKPLISEKSMADAKNGKFTFIITVKVDKKDIKKAVEEQFSVNVVDVATIIVKGKTKRVGKKRTEKNITAYKKAIVALKEGQKIALFDVGENK